MHKILIIATTFISMMFAGFVVPALAQTSNTNPVIGETANIVGEWRAVRIENLMWNDKTWTHENTVLKIIVEEQSGPVFRGEIHYNAPHAPGHDGMTERAEHKFDVLGVFS
ncbi:MAG: hypothetical protein O7A03_08710 [Alphaproteobacteria bacterium]|nr:hypothetical protein [Alphaproteobacteria bacterium]